ncbi:hypothetical protein BKA70DRAFT_1491684 [Coprinopsis sp. MPI-PUGE-AT-0042]|nr:hypothetical protein BKA70DRAFT_1491684 [Coprinopsis sp. MPI-PUGE-AT-0042]
MENANPEVGTYAIVNVRLPQWVLDTKEGVVVANPYMASPSQQFHPNIQWNLQSSDGISWFIQNVASERYLGLPVGENVRNCLTLREVNHKFAWHFRHYKGEQYQFLPHVPYTKHVIDLDPRNPKPGETVLYVHEDNAGAHQAWFLRKDLHLETSSVLQDGRTYMILNAQSNTAITMKDDHSVTCFQSDNREGQKFRAVKTASGWAFQNISSERYLGIPHSIVYPDNSPCLSSLEIEFTWMVLPHHEGCRKFNIWLPFTRKLLDLHKGQWEDDAPIQITGTIDVEHIWWRFEETPTPEQRRPNIGLGVAGQLGPEAQ